MGFIVEEGWTMRSVPFGVTLASLTAKSSLWRLTVFCRPLELHPARGANRLTVRAKRYLCRQFTISVIDIDPVSAFSLGAVKLRISARDKLIGPLAGAMARNADRYGHSTQDFTS